MSELININNLHFRGGMVLNRKLQLLNTTSLVCEVHCINLKLWQPKHKRTGSFNLLSYSFILAFCSYSKSQIQPYTDFLYRNSPGATFCMTFIRSYCTESKEPGNRYHCLQQKPPQTLLHMISYFNSMFVKYYFHFLTFIMVFLCGSS